MKKLISVFLLQFFVTCFAFSQEVRILSWNIFMVPPVVFKSCQTERAYLIADYIKEINADIVVLQESFMQSTRDIIFKSLNGIYAYQSDITKSGVIKMNSGVWILSKYPIAKQDFITYRKKKGSDIFAKKGATFIDVHIGRKKLQIIGTHTQSLQRHKSTRATQFRQIKEELADKYFLDSVPQFIIGDLNCNYYDREEYEHMQQLLDILPAQYSGEAYSWNGQKNDLAYTFSEHTLETLDYILLRKKNGERAEIICSEILRPYSDSCVCSRGFNYLSDHNPLISTVILK